MIIINKKEKNILDKVSSITITEYGVKSIPSKSKEKYTVREEYLLEAIEELLSAYKNLEEAFEDYKNNEEITDPYYYYGVNRKDFY